jgi:hypothetical protein
LTVSASLQARRQAIVDALRAVAAEAEQRVRAAAVETRLDDLSARLDAVETLLLEDAWERPPAAAASTGNPHPAVDDAVVGAVDHDAERGNVVPAVPLGEGRMSSVASRALFGH